MLTITHPTPIVETDFRHSVPQHEPLRLVVRTLREMNDRARDLATLHALERGAEGRARGEVARG